MPISAFRKQELDFCPTVPNVQNQNVTECAKKRKGRANQELYKTQCRWGSSCHHAHSEEELRSKPDLRCTAMCPHLIKWGKCTREDCTYAHAKSELVSTNAFVKTKLCNNPHRCSYGANCRYAHDVCELRNQVVLPKKARQRGVVNFGQQLIARLVTNPINGDGTQTNETVTSNQNKSDQNLDNVNHNVNMNIQLQTSESVNLNSNGNNFQLQQQFSNQNQNQTHMNSTNSLPNNNGFTSNNDLNNLNSATSTCASSNNNLNVIVNNDNNYNFNESSNMNLLKNSNSNCFKSNNNNINNFSENHNDQSKSTATDLISSNGTTVTSSGSSLLPSPISSDSNSVSRVNLSPGTLSLCSNSNSSSVSDQDQQKKLYNNNSSNNSDINNKFNQAQKSNQQLQCQESYIFMPLNGNRRSEHFVSNSFPSPPFTLNSSMIVSNGQQNNNYSAFPTSPNEGNSNGFTNSTMNQVSNTNEMQQQQSQYQCYTNNNFQTQQSQSQYNSQIQATNVNHNINQNHCTSQQSCHKNQTQLNSCLNFNGQSSMNKNQTQNVHAQFYDSNSYNTQNTSTTQMNQYTSTSENYLFCSAINAQNNQSSINNTLNNLSNQNKNNVQNQGQAQYNPNMNQNQSHNQHSYNGNNCDTTISMMSYQSNTFQANNSTNNNNTGNQMSNMNFQSGLIQSQSQNQQNNFFSNQNLNGNNTCQNLQNFVANQSGQSQQNPNQIQNESMNHSVTQNQKLTIIPWNQYSNCNKNNSNDANNLNCQATNMNSRYNDMTAGGSANVNSSFQNQNSNCMNNVNGSTQVTITNQSLSNNDNNTNSINFTPVLPSCMVPLGVAFSPNQVTGISQVVTSAGNTNGFNGTVTSSSDGCNSTVTSENNLKLDHSIECQSQIERNSTATSDTTTVNGQPNSVMNNGQNMLGQCNDNTIQKIQNNLLNCTNNLSVSNTGNVTNVMNNNVPANSLVMPTGDKIPSNLHISAEKFPADGRLPSQLSDKNLKLSMLPPISTTSWSSTCMKFTVSPISKGSNDTTSRTNVITYKNTFLNTPKRCVETDCGVSVVARERALSL